MMPYTLAMGLVWVLLAVLLGTVVGWLLRSVAARRQLEKVRAEADDASELERLRGRVAGLEPIVNERDRLRIELEAARAATGAPPEEAPAAPKTVPSYPMDDLTVVAGIDADVAELCRSIGIATWAELSVTEASLLKTMLSDAGRDLTEHDPSTWPEQARLLAAGSWSEFAVRFSEPAAQRVDD